MRRSLLLAGLALGLGATEVHAIDFPFGLLRLRQTPADPAAQARQLIQTLQNDTDTDARRRAAEELRNYDARNFPDIIAALSGSVQRDPAPAVRAAAVESLGRMKPVVQNAGLVMEAALTADPDPKVREAVRSSLWLYHLNGYRTAAGTPLTSQTPEPRLAPVTSRSARQFESGPGVGVNFRPITTSIGNAPQIEATPEPTLAVRRTPTVTPPPPAVRPAPSPAVKPVVPKPAGGLPLPEIPIPPVINPTPASTPAPLSPTRNF